MTKSESYAATDCCDASDCSLLEWSTPAEPCWGKTSVVEMHPGCMVHFCEGHGGVAFGDPYESEPKEEKTT